MAFSASNGQHEEEQALQHEINMTPFIDVILVLLIIFMVAAPLSTVSVPLELPGANAEADPISDELIILSLNASLDLYLNSEGDKPIDRQALAQVLDKASQGERQQMVFVRADESVPYKDVMSLLDQLRTIGYLSVSLVAKEQLI